MGNRLYVGNVPFAATNESLSAHFSQAGAVTDAQVMVDKFTGRPRGFAFVTMAGDADAQNAISLLHGQPYEGRTLSVTEARPREERPAGGPRRDFGNGGNAGGVSNGGASTEARRFGGGGGSGGGGGGRRFDRGERSNRGERTERGDRRERREPTGGGRRFESDDGDDRGE